MTRQVRSLYSTPQRSPPWSSGREDVSRPYPLYRVNSMKGCWEDVCRPYLSLLPAFTPPPHKQTLPPWRAGWKDVSRPYPFLLPTFPHTQLPPRSTGLDDVRHTQLYPLTTHPLSSIWSTGLADVTHPTLTLPTHLLVYCKLLCYLGAQ